MRGVSRARSLSKGLLVAGATVVVVGCLGLLLFDRLERGRYAATNSAGPQTDA